MTRRSMPPPPAVLLAPPTFLESPADNEDRQRQQKLIDEARKKREDKFEVYRDLYAKDFPKGIAVNHHGSRTGNREHHSSNNRCHDTQSRHEGKTVQQIWSQFAEGRRRNKMQTGRPTRRPSRMRPLSGGPGWLFRRLSQWKKLNQAG